MEPVGLKRGTVALRPYDEQWPMLFEVEKERLLVALKGLVAEIEHVGSTSVPGLAAKPLIDIIATVQSLADYKQAIAPLEHLGYEYMPERVFVDRVFFPKGPQDNRTYHLSLVEKGSAQWNDTLLFRDYLRNHPKKCQEYQDLKMRLATQYAGDRISYTKGKEAFIKNLLVLAQLYSKR
ncbi:MAG TPA: GrpB family protein [Patescibacteria group bacterium]|nr:GrpB family protein [Patescibacteria group bacterium]